MNTIPLVKGNTQEEINTSLIALKKALDEMNSSSSKTDASVQSQIKQINELITDINSHLDTIDEQITGLQPVDTVTSGNMHSVTSNAVAGALENKQTINPATSLNLPNVNEEINFYKLTFSTASIEGVKSALITYGFQNIRSGTSFIELVGPGGQRYTVILSHSGTNYFGGIVITYYYPITYIQYSYGT